MKLKSLAALAATTALCAPMAMAEDMANEMTIVSWGGAYQNSQLKAYVEPYLEKIRASASSGTKARPRLWPSCGLRKRQAT